MDKQTIQAMHDAAVQLGANCEPMDKKSMEIKSNYDVVDWCQVCIRLCVECIHQCESCANMGAEHKACIAACRECITACSICCVDCSGNATAAQCVESCKACAAACLKCMEACKVCAASCPECAACCTACADCCAECAECCAHNAGEELDADNDNEAGEMAIRRAPAQVKGKDEPKGELNLSYAKSLGVIQDARKLAVKFVAKDQIKGYTFLWGTPGLTDVEIEYFTKDSNFWDDRIGKSARPLTWDHAQDESFKAHPVIGEITDFGDDELGRWYVAKLDTSHKYRKVIDQLIHDGVLGTSSDSAPQYVVREKTGKSVWLKEWPWFASALTNTPAEPRMIGSLEFFKSLGVVLPDVDATRQRYELLKRQSEFLKLKSTAR